MALLVFIGERNRRTTMRYQGFDPYAQPVQTHTAQPTPPQPVAPAAAPQPVAARADDEPDEERTIEEPGYGHGV